ncbi:hypothetical protein ABVN18_16495 [Pseudomonas canadensis]|uniref:hypothetical protein n=1 Tax=Pseudomonas canadensis TaxID=915099 RepID=UPI00336AC529
MKNERMISVKPLVLEKALRDAGLIRFATDSHVVELRALLDAPACKVCNDTGKMHEPGEEPGSCAACRADPMLHDPAAQTRGEPVAWRVTGRGGLTVTPEYPKWAVGERGLTITPLYAEQPAPVAVASREESIYWLKRIDGIGQNSAELIYSMGFRRHTEVPQSL